ncbi:MAG: beta-hydroxyacyl-ACP dehydratase, partial [Planctomycetota bacterium]|nr:beta-hydroxyacyl-ACP dehydratase [Planctomycetota bacterium]
GVLLCEIIFQAGAALMAHRLGRSPGAGNAISGTPVVVRIRDARFKRMVKPGETLEIEAHFEEQVANAYFLHGTAKVEGEVAARVAFTCALVP